MSITDYKKISYEGLWKNNAALVQLLGLCPLLAVSNSAINALGLGIATIMVLTLSNLCVSIIRQKVTNEIRLPAFVMIIASVTTCIELLMQAFTFELYQILGIFIPLIVTNCAVLGRADSFAAKNKALPSMVDGFMIGFGFAIVLLLLGIVREILGQGTVFDNMDLLLGPIAENWALRFTSTDYSFLFAVLPPGAFVIMGFIIAIKNIIDKKLIDHAETIKTKAIPGNKRVRVTDS